MEQVLRVSEAVKSFRETRLSALRPVSEFFDHQRISRPADLNQATSRLSYNARYFSGNYGLVVAILAIYALLTSPFLLFTLLYIVGGFTLINRYVAEPLQFGETVVTQKSLYAGLFGTGFILICFAPTFSVIFWLIGASAFTIIFHAVLMEPGIESEYANIEGGTSGA